MISGAEAVQQGFLTQEQLEKNQAATKGKLFRKEVIILGSGLLGIWALSLIVIMLLGSLFFPGLLSKWPLLFALLTGVGFSIMMAWLFESKGVTPSHFDLLTCPRCHNEHPEEAYAKRTVEVSYK